MKCPKCNYEWKCNSNHLYVSCPSCMKKVKNTDLQKHIVSSGKYDLLQIPEIRNLTKETVAEWKACRDKLCLDSGIKCNTCLDYNACEKRIYDELHKKRNSI